MPNSSYQLLKDINDAVERLEGKFDTRMKNIEDRVTLIEKFQNKVVGIAIVISSIITLAGQTLWQKLTNS